ncbi:MAG: DUF4214 domain-containing protein [Acidobacteria bacterium]|nr:DUF4214 domain-containing protein [Acidobacteriota bacterium]
MRRFLAACSLLALFSLCAFAQQSTPPTLRVVTEDPTLPSDLYYGDTRVKPVRLRPGTNQRITIDDSDFFVQQQYIDFLSRFPDASGFGDWMNYLAACNGDNTCLNAVGGRRVTVSANFFLSTEFQIKGFYAFRFYKAAFNRLPEYAEMTADMRAVTGTTSQEVFQKKAAYAQAFVQRAEFAAAYGSLANDAYVNALMDRYQLASIRTPNPAAPDDNADTSKVTLTRAQLVSQLNGATLTRAQVLRAVVDSDQVGSAEFTSGFVSMQYYGYLRRKPDPSGYADWTNYLNAHPRDFNTMVFGFVYSPEYRNRF